jgi:RNA-directed DNA polymerase
MKTYKNLYPQVCTFENLFLAFRSAAKGKRGRPEVAAFEQDLEPNLFRLQEELEAQTYHPSPYYHFAIHDPKPRVISAAPFRDRVVHHALVRVIEPIFEARFIHDSYACREGKGTHAALDRAQEFARRFRYVLQCDLVHFFPAIDHAILRATLARLIADAHTMHLIDLIIDSGRGIPNHHAPHYFPGDDGDAPRRAFAASRPRGLPIGNLTSQFWANCYLDPLDQFVKRDLKCGRQRGGYVRYVDDFLLFADDKPTLWEWKRAIADHLIHLRMRLHDRESTVYPITNGIPFLGFRIYPHRRRLKRRNGVAFARRFRSLRAQLAAGEITQERLYQSVQGWLAHAAHGDTLGLRRALVTAHPIPRSPL